MALRLKVNVATARHIPHVGRRWRPSNIQSLVVVRGVDELRGVRVVLSAELLDFELFLNSQHSERLIERGCIFLLGYISLQLDFALARRCRVDLRPFDHF